VALWSGSFTLRFGGAFELTHPIEVSKGEWYHVVTSGGLTFTPRSQGTVMAWDWQVRPKGWLRLLGPVFSLYGGRMERRI